MRIKITSDSTCDLTSQQLQQHSITVIPLYINIGEKCLRDGLDIVPDDIYAHVSGGGDICSTAACNITDYTQAFDSFSREYDAVIHMNISSDFSSCHQNACLAAQEFDNVYVVDSRNLTTGHGHLVMRCAKLAESGMDPLAIVEDLNAFVSKVDTSFILSQLEYLKKGGRCSSVAALGTNLLGLKPCIEVVDGKMKVGKKYRGSYEKCLEQYIRDRLANIDELDLERIFITHSGVEEKALQLAQQLVSQHANFQDVVISRAGCTISSHCGPGTMGIIFVRK